MCDIVVLECCGCGKKVDSHLGDFSVGRGQVSVYCSKPGCQKKAMQVLRGDRSNWSWQVTKISKSTKKLVMRKRNFGKLFRNSTYIVFGDRGYLFLVEWPREIGLNR